MLDNLKLSPDDGARAKLLQFILCGTMNAGTKFYGVMTLGHICFFDATDFSLLLLECVSMGVCVCVCVK